MSEYREHDPRKLGDYYTRHIMAMTAEKLHDKSAIAAELAYRDKRIAELKAENKRLLDALSKAYGLLWHVNNCPELTGFTPARMAYKARHILRDLLTNEERGTGICTAKKALEVSDDQIAELPYRSFNNS